jgi:hypothetical protein
VDATHSIDLFGAVRQQHTEFDLREIVMGLYPPVLSNVRTRIRRALTAREGRRPRRKRTDFVFKNSAAIVQTLEQRVLPTTVWVASTQDASEAGQVGSVTLQRDNTAGMLQVSYTIDGSSTAQNGVDFSFLSGTVTFADGANTAVISVNPLNDELVEPTETLTINLTSAPPMPGPGGGSGYTIGSQSSGTIQITDNDVPPNMPPILASFSVTTTDGEIYTFTGQVTDEWVASCYIVFGGLLEGHTAGVDLDGRFSYTVTLGGAAEGFVFAQAYDSLGEASDDAYVYIA